MPRRIGARVIVVASSAKIREDNSMEEGKIEGTNQRESVFIFNRVIFFLFYT